MPDNYPTPVKPPKEGEAERRVADVFGRLCVCVCDTSQPLPPSQTPSLFLIPFLSLAPLVLCD